MFLNIFLYLEILKHLTANLLPECNTTNLIIPIINFNFSKITSKSIDFKVKTCIDPKWITDYLEKNYQSFSKSEIFNFDSIPNYHSIKNVETIWLNNISKFVISSNTSLHTKTGQMNQVRISNLFLTNSFSISTLRINLYHLRLSFAIGKVNFSTILSENTGLTI